MKVIELIEFLEAELEADPTLADKDVVMMGEESGDTVDVVGITEHFESIRFCSEECEIDEDEEGS